MSPFTRPLLVVCILVSLAPLPLLAQGKAEGRIVKAIAIEGNRRIPERKIRAAIRTRVGEPYRSDVVDQDMGRIWALGYFEDIKARTEPKDVGVKVVFTVAERPIIAKVIFLGNKKIKEAKLREASDLKEGSFVSPYSIISARRRIVDKYKEEGFQFAEVDSKREETDGQVTVTFVIAEGPRLRIRKVSIKGNKAFSRRQLMGKIKTRRRVWPFYDGIYNESVLESDLLAIKDFYQANGWLDVEVGRELKYNDEKTRLYITIFVQEGERYYVDTVTIKGNELFTDKEIRRRLTLKSGAPFVRENLNRDQKVVKGMYGEQGFIDAEVRISTPLSLEPAKINIVFTITEGQRIYVEKIDIRGNTKTEDHVIRREVTFYPGERFNTRKMEESKRRIYNTRLFESYDPIQQTPPVQTDIEPGSDPLHRTAVFNVQEGRTGQLSFGAGISSNLGLIGQFSLSQSNFNLLDLPTSFSDFVSGNAFVGGGQTLSLTAQPGTERSQYSLSFREPSAFDSPYGFGMTSYFYDHQREDYDEQRIGGSVSVDRRITRNLRVGLTYGAQQIDIRDIHEQWAPADVFDVEGVTTRLSLELRVVYDTRNNVLWPTKGVKIEPSVELAGMFLGGDVDTIKADIGLKWYHKLFTIPKWGDHVLSVGMQAGVIDSLDRDEVPIFDRFFAGGPGGAASLRGFSYRGIGPIDPVIREQIGGEVRWLSTVEYEVPIVQKTIRAVGFFDAGNVNEFVSDVDFSTTRASAGIGLRLTFPQLGYIPIELDWGFPVRSQPFDSEQLFSFNIGGGMRF
ncbi:MAG: outer membrane protein assembly factor BamA [Planctomycetes bacterium]|nr:outer membrane protein assembly factor BamA [Planctomycetota bacterium]